MIPFIDIPEAFIRAWLAAPSRRWRRACLAAVRESRRLDRMALAMAEQRERQVAEWERARCGGGMFSE